MFGMGLGELLLVAIVAIVFLGPEKLPNAMVETAKFFRKVKKSLTDAKGALDEELKLSELKSDALSYKEKIESSTKAVLDDTGVEKSGREVKDLFSDLSIDTPNEKTTPVSFDKKDDSNNPQPKA